MTDAVQKRRVIPAREVGQGTAPVLVESVTKPDGTTDTMAVVPLTEGTDIRGFEVRCQCGAAVIVECVTEEQAANEESTE